jgi:26S proteasome regulatory subunit (ATPase 3-interacting protein)
MGKKKANADTSSSGLDKDEQTVLDYLVKQNRPYSAIDVFNNLHGAVGKTACVRVLSSLSERNLIHQKVYGKQSVFVARQDTGNVPTPEELTAIDAQVEDAKRELAEANSRVAGLQAQLQSQTSTMPTDKLRDAIGKMNIEIKEKNVRLESLKTSGYKVDPVDREKVVKESEMLTKLLSKRRRLCMDIVGGILEGAGDALGRKTVKEFMEEIGCELE